MREAFALHRALVVKGGLLFKFETKQYAFNFSGVSPHWNTEESSNALEREECRNIRKLIQLLPNGNLLRAQVHLQKDVYFNLSVIVVFFFI